MDTKKLLDAVERQKSESASLRELARGQTRALQDAATKMGEMSDQIGQLKAKLEQASQTGGADQSEQIKQLQDQVAQLQASAVEAQSDIDKAADELDADNQDVQDAISANVQPSQSGGGSQGSSSSSSASTASGGGGEQSSGDVKKPDPLPGTGAAQSSSSTQDQGGSEQSSQQPSQIAPTDTPALSGGIADPAKPGSMPPPEDTDAAGQSSRSLGSDPTASRAPPSGS